MTIILRAIEHNISINSIHYIPLQYFLKLIENTMIFSTRYHVYQDIES